MISHTTDSLRKPVIHVVRMICRSWLVGNQNRCRVSQRVAWHIAKRGSRFRLSALLNQTVFLEQVDQLGACPGGRADG